MPHAHEVFEQHAKTYGHPSHPMSHAERVALVREGKPVPVLHGGLSVITPPPPGQCCHCGATCGKSAGVRQHAVAGFEFVRHPESGEPLRFVVTHCKACLGSDACRSDVTTPGCGREDAGGFCEALPTEIALGVSLFPGAPYVGRFLKWALLGTGLWVAASMATLFTSQGQQVADFQGPVTSLINPGDATAGHGFNAGLLRVLSGAAPGSGASQANAAETGTLGISWTLAATAFGTSTSATPSVATANAVSNVTISNTITAGYARLVTSTDGAALSTTDRRYQLDVGTSGASVNFNTLSLVSGGTASLTSLTITHGN